MEQIGRLFPLLGRAKVCKAATSAQAACRRRRERPSSGSSCFSLGHHMRNAKMPNPLPNHVLHFTFVASTTSGIVINPFNKRRISIQAKAVPVVLQCHAENTHSMPRFLHGAHRRNGRDTPRLPVLRPTDLALRLTYKRFAGLASAKHSGYAARSWMRHDPTNP